MSWAWKFDLKYNISGFVVKAAERIGWQAGQRGLIESRCGGGRWEEEKEENMTE